MTDKLGKRYKPDFAEICLKNDDILGICLGTTIEGYRVQISMFKFKFDTRAESVNFCVKHSIPLSREYRLEYSRIWMPQKGDVYLNENGEVKRWE